MAKPVAKWIPSDDCLVTVDGEELALHEGESVRAMKGVTVHDLKMLRGFAEMQSKIAEHEGEPEEAIRSIVITDDVFDSAVKFLAPRIIEWTWTDDLGEPLPQPHNNPEVLRALRIDELLYLVGVVKGGQPAAEKKDTPPLPTTSSDTEPQPAQT